MGIQYDVGKNASMSLSEVNKFIVWPEVSNTNQFWLKILFPVHLIDNHWCHYGCLYRLTGMKQKHAF